MSVFLRIIYAAVLIAALLVGYRAYVLHDTASFLRQASMGQALGPEDAKVTIAEFLDYRCGFCRQVAPVVKDVAARHPDVRIVYRHLPVFGRESVIEAEFALAAGMQGKFIQAHDYLTARDEPLEDSGIEAAARELGLDYARLSVDMKGPEIGDLLLANIDAADRLGITATPGFVINGAVLRPNDLGRLPTAEDFDALIAQARR